MLAYRTEINFLSWCGTEERGGAGQGEQSYQDNSEHEHNYQPV